MSEGGGMGGRGERVGQARGTHALVVDVVVLELAHLKRGEHRPAAQRDGERGRTAGQSCARPGKVSVEGRKSTYEMK